MKVAVLALAALASPLLQAEVMGAGICVSLPDAPVDARYLDCLSAALAPSEEAHDAREALRGAADARIARDPAAQGLYTRAATQLRLGGNFGVSPVPAGTGPVFLNPLLPPPAVK